MKKTFYFPHDYHARHDPELEKLRMTMGCEGIGIFWCLAEMLYEQEGYLLLSDIDSYAKALNTKADNIHDVINGYKLFQKDDERFFSISVLARLKHIKDKSEKAKESISRRWNTNVIRTNNEGNTIKERKGKEIKEITTLPEADFLKNLKTTYDYIDIDTEMRKIDGWLLANPKRKKTKKFIINWLNRIERPMDINNGAPGWGGEKGKL